jgi:hypothetical protein
MPFESFVLSHQPIARLRTAIEQRTGALANDRRAMVASGGGCYMGDARGVSCVFAGDARLFGTASPDFILNLSRELGGKVASFSIDTALRRTMFLAADNGRPLRFFVSAPDMRAPLSLGEPFPSETTAWLDTRAGIWAALRHLGLAPVDDWLVSAEKTQVDYPTRFHVLAKEESTFRLARVLREHEHQHKTDNDSNSNQNSWGNLKWSLIVGASAILRFVVRMSEPDKHSAGASTSATRAASSTRTSGAEIAGLLAVSAVIIVATLLWRRRKQRLAASS